MTDRDVLVVAHTGRHEAIHVAREVVEQLSASGVRVRMLPHEAADLDCPSAVEVAGDDAANGAEMVIVLGGDGTLLRAAEIARPAGAPVLGINLGQVGFLAEAERAAVGETVDAVLGRRYTVEERMTLDVTLHAPDGAPQTGWALNDVSLEKLTRQRMLELVIEVDGRPLSRWGGDGVVFATPTGSTAYAFSAGGPVVWPDVEALLLVPISAHALFARPLVTAPDSLLAAEVPAGAEDAVLWCDGRRSLDAPSGSRVEVRRGARPVRLARLHDAPFTDRLVAKFGLPVRGWRGHAGPG